MAESSKFGNWHALLKGISPQAVQAGINKTIVPGMLRAGEAIRREIVLGIKTRGSSLSSPMKPLHPFTITRKGSDAPLVDHGDLLGAITVVSEPAEVAVGVMRSTKSRGGKPTYNIAIIHEYGAAIGVTDKMRAFLHAVGLHLRATTTVLHIPARPVFGPAAIKAEPIVNAILDNAAVKFVDGLVPTGG